MIGSAASKDKNTLTTGTLSWEDKENKADYKNKDGMGVSYSPNVQQQTEPERIDSQSDTYGKR